MREKVAIATVQGKSYFLIVNQLRENNIPFISLVPGEPIPAKIKLVITTEQEKQAVNHEKIMLLNSETELDSIISEIKKSLLGKEAYEKIVIGLDPGVAIGLAVLADGKNIEECNCYNTQEVVKSILKVIRNVNMSQTAVCVKIGNGVPLYKEIVESLDDVLPSKVTLEVVGESGTNKPLKENRRSRGIRHISSAIHIAGRNGQIIERTKIIAANS